MKEVLEDANQKVKEYEKGKVKLEKLEEVRIRFVQCNNIPKARASPR
jgi:hypothetical protein